MTKSTKKVVVDVEEKVVSLENTEEKTVSEQKETVFIYCGPTNNYIARYTSYKNGYPLHLKEHIEKFPALKSLFVEPENFAEFERNVVQPGTVENIQFEKAKDYFSKAVK